MKKSEFKISNRLFFRWGFLTVLFFGLNFAPVFAQNVLQQEEQIEKAKIFREIYPLISESDLYCSLLVWDEKLPDIQIIGAEREYEKILLTDGNIIYINKGSRDGLEPGQLFMILEIKEGLKDFGTITYKRGRARLLALEESRASARIEKSCSNVMVGHYLVPFEEGESRLGKDFGYSVSPFERDGLKGKVIYLQTEFNQVGSGHWALIDLGSEQGIQKGDQLILYRKIEEGAPLQVFGNSVVIDAQKRTSTIKVLSCRDPLRIDDLVMPHPKESP